MSQPSIHTARLLLRPFAKTDAAAVQRLAGDKAIADTTLNIPHPYEDGIAEAWIDGHDAAYDNGDGVTFAIVLCGNQEFIGAIGLRIDQAANIGNLGYWVGKPHWNQGYATEATSAVLEFGLEFLGLDRICANHLARNPASGRVMQKAGMHIDETAVTQVVKSGRLEPLTAYECRRRT